MSRKIVIATDSFKESLSSLRAAEAMASGVRRIWPDAVIDIVPLGDGGEGTAEVLADALDAVWVSCPACGPLMEPITARYAFAEATKTAVMEMAEAAGLALVPPERRNPLYTSTYGFGMLIADALKRGAESFLVGIGGSSTNDAGAGMLSALGYRFYDASGHLIQARRGIDLADIARMEGTVPRASFAVACDVANPLFGPDGAACVFAPQKGAAVGDVALLDRGLRGYAGALVASGYKDVSDLRGAGAAGGLGGTFAAVLGARLVPGIDMVLDAVDFGRRLEDATLVITGEGRIDRQTAMGKAPAGVLAAARSRGIPVVAIGGSLGEGADSCGFDVVRASMPAGMSLQEAMRPEVAERNLADATAYCISHLPN